MDVPCEEPGTRSNENDDSFSGVRHSENARARLILKALECFLRETYTVTLYNVIWHSLNSGSAGVEKFITFKKNV